MSELDISYVSTAKGLPLAVVETGNAQGPPVIFLHGFGFSHIAFKPQLESDLAQDFRLIAFDMRGHGDSAKPWSEEDFAGHEIWADDLELVLNARGVFKATLVGWSYGAMVAMDWLRKYGPSRAAGFLFAGSHGGLRDYSDEELARKRALITMLKVQPTSFAAGLADNAAFVDRMVARPIDDELRRWMLLSRQMLPHYCLRAMGSRMHQNADLRTRLSRPLLLVQGEKDFANPAATLKPLIDSVPHARLKVLDGVGHAPQLEAPDAFNAILRNFVSKIHVEGTT
jgi:pimeloyl-ACP methyl ester carboxylesterase